MLDDPIMMPYGGIHTFMRAKMGSFADLSPGKIGVFGVPYEGSVPGKPGTKYGPRAIREGSVHFIYYLQTSTEKKMVNLRTREVITFPDELPVVDLGDAAVFPNNMEAMNKSIASMMQRIVSAGAFPMMMGGDHYTTIPAFQGLAEAVLARKKNAKLGYIQFDAHLDLMDENPIFGKYSSASPARRISEMSCVDPRNIVIIGPGGFTRVEQYEYAQKQGITIFTEYDVQSLGIEAVAEKAGQLASDGCDTVYVSTDIDAVSAAYAPGTGTPNMSGISASQLLAAVDILTRFPVGAFDVVEVTPQIDPCGITAKLGAVAMTSWVIAKHFKRDRP